MTASVCADLGLDSPQLATTCLPEDARNMDQSPDTALLESLARDTHAPFDEVVALFERERDALAREATIPNYINLLAARRVRDRLLAGGDTH